MNITLIWFPIAKLLLTIGLLYGVYFFVKKKQLKTALFFGITIVLFWLMSPVKYDGTNSVQRSIETQQLRTIEYDTTTDSSDIVHTSKLSFEERMLLEEQRSNKANQKIQKDIIE